jgi:hypothetical protein
MDSKPTLLTVPCFAGAPWQLDQLDQLQGWPMRTMRLPKHLDDPEKLADFVLGPAWDIDKYVLVFKDPAGILLGGIRRSREVILPRTGHMFRFSHPSWYSEAVHKLLHSNTPTIGGTQ